MLKSLVQFGNSFLTDEEAKIVAKLREQKMNQELSK
jgi:hypothetical protein